MKVIYRCGICGSEYENMQDAISCERDCMLNDFDPKYLKFWDGDFNPISVTPENYYTSAVYVYIGNAKAADAMGIIADYTGEPAPFEHTTAKYGLFYIDRDEWHNIGDEIKDLTKICDACGIPLKEA